jgi:hypothetical protein
LGPFQISLIAQLAISAPASGKLLRPAHQKKLSRKSAAIEQFLKPVLERDKIQRAKKPRPQAAEGSRFVASS